MPDLNPSQVLPASEIARALRNAGDVRQPAQALVLRFESVDFQGPVDLRAVTTPLVLEFAGCRFDSAFDVGQAGVAGLRFRECELPAFSGRNLTSRTDLVLADVAVAGEVDLTDADVTGSLTLARGSFGALTAARISVGGAVLADGLWATGTVSFSAARIGDAFLMRDARLDVVPDASALLLDRAVVGGTVELDRCVTTAALRLTDLRVDGSVRLSEAEVGSSPDGLVDLGGAAVGADVDLSDSRVATLNAENVQVGRDLLGTDLRVTNGVLLRRANVGRRLSLDGAVLAAIPSGGSALNLFDVRTQDLVLRLGTPPVGKVTLRKAQCASLTDDDRLWDATGGLDLAEFSYETLGEPIFPEDDLAVRHRLSWLRHAMPDYQPGPYDQLIAVLRAAGLEKHATTVHIEKQRQHYAALAGAARVYGPAIRVLSIFLRTAFGYGYRISRAVLWLLFLWVTGTIWFGYHEPPPLIRPTERWPWNPAMYTLDLLVPLVDLGNKNRWSVSGVSQGIAASLTIMGWVLATTIAAEIARTLRRPS